MAGGQAKLKGIDDMADNQGYLAFMVRLWTAQQNGDVTWRASVENVHTGAHQAFASLDDLLAFLRLAAEIASSGHVEGGDTDRLSGKNDRC